LVAPASAADSAVCGIAISVVGEDDRTVGIQVVTWPVANDGSRLTDGG